MIGQTGKVVVLDGASDPMDIILSYKYKAFVYGTLMSGLGNSRFIDDVGQADRISALTMKQAVMYDFGGFPAVKFTHTHAGAKKVKGELVMYNDVAIRNSMDMLEGHPSFYKRVPIKVAAVIAGKCYTVECESYEIQGDMNRRTLVSTSNQVYDWRKYVTEKENS